ncbi:MAG: UDP-N-acetylmuramate--L-alanine ligase [Bacteroidota bacterium]
MDLQKIKNVYLLGIGGIGMSALARYFHAAGKVVSGYDKTPTSLTNELVAEGIPVSFIDSIDQLPGKLQSGNADEFLIIYTPAIPKDHKQYNFFLSNAVEMYKRSVVLGWITKQAFTIAVAGTHGKTTTSCIITHLLKSAGVNCTAFLGGISANYNTNLILGDVNAPDAVVVVEADEFDRSFLTLHPDIAVITSMDADHLDIYGDKSHLEDSFRLFAQQVKVGGHLFFKAGLPLNIEMPNQHSYSITSTAAFSATEITIKNHQYIFNINTPSAVYSGWTSGMPGRHNVENAVVAVAVALELGITPEKIREGLESFAGVKRRFEYQVQSEKCTYIDDYAHHPEELRAAISSVKELYSDKKITGVFQPHLFSRTRDFVDGFAESLSLLDSLLLLDIYPARELPMAGVTSQIIFDKVTIQDKEQCTKEELLSILGKRKPEVLLTLGAGDIDQLVQPIKKLLS